MNMIEKLKSMKTAVLINALAVLALFGHTNVVKAYARGQLTIDGLFLLGIAVIIGAILYVVGNQVLNQNNLQNTGLFPTGLFLLSVMPVLIALLALFRPR